MSHPYMLTYSQCINNKSSNQKYLSGDIILFSNLISEGFIYLYCFLLFNNTSKFLLKKPNYLAEYTKFLRGILKQPSPVMSRISE